jgi:hypothetical protein
VAAGSRLGGRRPPRPPIARTLNIFFKSKVTKFAFEDFRAGLDLFSGIGLIIIGGDFNSRCVNNK